jgi:ribosome-binding factor A
LSYRNPSYRPQGGKRLLRINDEIKKELANILRGGELKDPRAARVTSVIKVETTNDLKHCKAAVSVLGSDEDKREVLSILGGAAGFIKKLIADRLDLRQTPDFTFVLDDSVEHGIKMTELIKTLNINYDSDSEDG